MISIKCPNCNAPLQITPGTNVFVCEYCNTQSVLERNVSELVAYAQPKQDDFVIENFNVFTNSLLKPRVLLIYRDRAEILLNDVKTIDTVVEFSKVTEYKCASSSILFKFEDKKKLRVLFATAESARAAVAILDKCFFSQNQEDREKNSCIADFVVTYNSRLFHSTLLIYKDRAEICKRTIEKADITIDFANVVDYKQSFFGVIFTMSNRKKPQIHFFSIAEAKRATAILDMCNFPLIRQ